MPEARYAVGIDLGTTHCAVASSPLDRNTVTLSAIPQLIAPGEALARPLLPSFVYLPAEGEFAPGDLRLPWGEAQAVVGELARRRGAQVPDRLVASAKSWICHGGVNRRAPILPWSAPEGIPQISPFDASVRYLQHLVAAWDADHPDAPLAAQEVVVTVPASFDEVARELTSAAARKAGLPNVRLLEEPQAAFYDFLGAHADDLGAALGSARLALVVDVGGGTTDLTLVRIAPDPAGGAPLIERVAVGGHLMLGGDNMDAALAHHVLKVAEIERKLDPTEWAALVQASRQTKEDLLSAAAPATARVSIQRRGRRLIGGTVSVTLDRDAVRAVLLDGFMPATDASEVADRKGRAGLTTLGLPYTTDPAIPRHVNAFLRKHRQAAEAAGATVVGGLPRPDVVLLNGGVFNAPAMVTRFEAVLAGWFGEGAVSLLPHTSLDTAVAQGAARAVLARHGHGQVIAGGAARAYYVGVEGADGQAQAFCLAPKGMEEGATVEAADHVLRLVLDRPVAFRLYADPSDRADAVGAVIDVTADDLEPLPPIETVLRRQGDLWVDPQTGSVPVRLSATLMEGGTLALYLVTVELPPRRWRLEFGLGDVEAPAATPATAPAPVAPPEAAPEPLPPRFDEARRALERIFGGGREGHDARAAKGLRRELEGVLGPRGEWSSTVCRAIFDVLMARRERRGGTPEHELNWLRLVSWGVRPGLGFQGDSARIEQLWQLYGSGLAHPTAKANWGEWWVLWRRVAAGLDPTRQRALFDAVAPWIQPMKGVKALGDRPHGYPELLRALAAMEHLSPEQKARVAGWLQTHFKKVNSWWPLGRLGARAPLYGAPTTVVPTATAEAWLTSLLALDWATADGAAFAAVSIARVTGDPQRDVAPALRAQVAQRLADSGAPSPWIEQVTQATAIDDADTRRILGEALPAGLRLS